MKNPLSLLTTVTPNDTIAFSMLRWVLAGLRAAGIHNDVIANETGWTSSPHPDTRVSYAAATKLVDGAIRATNDPAFGLHAAAKLDAKSLSPALETCLSSRTCADLLRHSARYLRLHDDPMALEVETSERGTTVRLAFSPPSLDRAARATADFVMAALVLAVRASLDTPNAVTGVSFRHAAPSYRSDYESILQAPVRFGAPSFQIELAPQSPPRRSAQPPSIPAYLRTCSGHAMAKLAPVGPVSTGVRMFLTNRLPWGIPSMTQTATGVQQTVQGLHDRLIPEHTTFAGLREELMRELACEYLRDKTLSIPEVAHVMGFIDVQVFKQTVQRWLGATPQTFRGPLEQTR